MPRQRPSCSWSTQCCCETPKKKSAFAPSEMFSGAAGKRVCSLLAACCSVSRQMTVGEGSRVRFYVLHSCVRTAAGHPETDERLRRGLLPTARWLPAGRMAACPRQRLTYRATTGSWPLARERGASLSWERVGSVGKRGSAVAVSRRRRMACPGECRPRCPVCPCGVVECQLVCYLHCRRN